MSKIKVYFIFKDKKLEFEFIKDDLIQNIFSSFANKINRNMNNFNYVYNSETIINYENNDIVPKSDAPYREIPPFLRLCRCRGMLHTGTMEIALTGCVAHRSKQGKRTAPFSRAERFLRSQGDTP